MIAHTIAAFSKKNSTKYIFTFLKIKYRKSKQEIVFTNKTKDSTFIKKEISCSFPRRYHYNGLPILLKQN